MLQAKKALLTLLRSPQPSRTHGPGATWARPGVLRRAVKVDLLSALPQGQSGRAQEGKRPRVQPSASSQRFLVQIQFLRTCSERLHSSPFQGPVSGQRFPGASLTTVSGSDPLESVSSCLGLKQVLCPSQMGTSGRLSAPTSFHSQLLEEQNSTL